MRAQSEAGRTTEALRQFEAYRMLLRDDIGIEPAAALVDLDRAIVAGDDLTTLRERGHPAWSTRRRGDLSAVAIGRSGLPTPISSFVGRVREATDIGALVGQHRLVTLTGAGGSGKSRLALRVASALADRATNDSSDAQLVAWWIDLDAAAADSDVAEHLATEIGVVPRRDPVAEVARRLQGRRSLVVFDNAEHVVDATAAVVVDLLTRCSDAHALVTSRVPLGLAGEVVWQVTGLGMPDDPAATVTFSDLDRHDAIRLFLTRAREARPGMAVDRHAVEHIVSICTELDGLPLALELAAARLRTLPLPVVAESIGEMIGWKGRNGHAPLARHATLRASIEWSFELISLAEQQLLIALATFRSPFETDAAVAVARAMDCADDAPEHLGRLAEVGLLQFDEGGRYRMLNTVRQFCRTRGADHGLLERAEEAHAQYFADWCEAVGAGRMGLERRPLVRRMPDVVAALSWARDHDHRAALRMCRGLAPVRSTLGQHADFDVTWRWLTTLPPDERDALWAAALAGSLATATSSPSMQDTALAEQAVLERLPDGPGRARAWLERGRAMVPAYRGRPGRIMAYVDGLLDRGDDLEASVYAGFAAYMLALMGRNDDCQPLLDALARLTRRHATAFDVGSVGNGYAAAIVSETLAGDLRTALERGRRPVPSDPSFSITSAAALAHAALLTTDVDMMHRAIEWSTLGSLPLLGYLTPFSETCAALLEHRVTDAADLAETFWDNAERVPVWRVFALPVVTSALLGAGRARGAAQIIDVAASLMIDMEHAPNLTVSIHVARGLLAVAFDEREVAQLEAGAALDLARREQLPLAVVDALDVLAAVANGRDDALASSSRRRAAFERQRLGYRFTLIADHSEHPTSTR